MPRWGSRGGSNRRSSLWFLAFAKRSKFQRGHCAKAEQRIVLRAICRQILAGKVRASAPFTKGEKAKEDRRFESPLLQQRVGANHRSRWRLSKSSRSPTEQAAVGSTAIPISTTTWASARSTAAGTKRARRF